LALDHWPALRALLSFCGAAALAAGLSLIDPSAAGLAIARLAMPWRDLAWPRQHELAFLQPPERLAKGDDLELTLMDRRGPLPEDTELLVRHETPSGWRTEVRPMKPVGDRVIFRLDNVTHDFQYRAHGGDDNAMPWI